MNKVFLFLSITTWWITEVEDIDSDAAASDFIVCMLVLTLVEFQVIFTSKNKVFDTLFASLKSRMSAHSSCNWFTYELTIHTVNNANNFDLFMSWFAKRKKKNDDLEVSKNEKKQIFNDVKTCLKFWMCESLCFWMFEANFLKAFICSQKAIEKQLNLIVRKAWIDSWWYNEVENCAKQSSRRLTEKAYKNITSLFDNSNKIRSLSSNTILQNRSIDSIFEQAYFKNLILSSSSLILVEKLV